MSNDKTIRIGIETTSDTSGAKQAAADIEDVKDKAQEADAALKQTDSGGIRNISQDAKPAAGSIDALEAEVRQLQAELNKLPVGSQQFVALAAKAKEAQKTLSLAEAEARKLGGTVGRKGNMGMAVLEASRLMEDAQYGIRGVLNNIPGLIAMLGGSAGLAGVISIVAVGASVLWEQFGGGAKKAKKETETLLDVAKQLQDVFESFEKGEREKLAEWIEERAKMLTGALRGNEARFKLTTDAADMDVAREKGQTLIELGLEQLELSRVNAQLVTETGEKAVALTKDREAVLERIYQKEREIADIPRLAAEEKAAGNLQRADENVESLKKNDAAIRDEINARKEEVAALRTQAEQTRGSNLRMIAVYEKEIAARKEMVERLLKSIKANPDGARSYASMGALYEEEIKEFQDKIRGVKADNRQSLELSNQADSKDKTLEPLTKQLEESAAAQREAAKAQAQATIDLRNLREVNRTQRATEEGQKTIADAGALDEKIRDEGKKVADETGAAISEALRNIGDAANSPQVQSTVARIRELAAGGIEGGEQNEIVMLFQQLMARSQAGFTANTSLMNRFIGIVERSVTTMGQVNSRLDEQDRRLKDLERATRSRR